MSDNKNSTFNFPFSSDISDAFAKTSLGKYSSSIDSMGDYSKLFTPAKKEKKGNFLTGFIDKMPGFGADKEGKSYLDRFLEGYSYRPQKQSGQEEFFGQLAKNMGGGSRTVSDVAEGLTLTDKEGRDPIIASGTPGSKGLLETVGVPLLGAYLCDVKAKEDIAPLCTSEINDVLSECAYFVKDLNECS